MSTLTEEDLAQTEESTIAVKKEFNSFCGFVDSKIYESSRLDDHVSVRKIFALEEEAIRFMHFNKMFAFGNSSSIEEYVQTKHKQNMFEMKIMKEYTHRISNIVPSDMAKSMRVERLTSIELLCVVFILLILLILSASFFIILN